MRNQCIKHHALSGLSRPSLQLICISLLRRILIQCITKVTFDIYVYLLSDPACIGWRRRRRSWEFVHHNYEQSLRVASSNSLAIKTTAKLLICYCHISLDAWMFYIRTLDYSDVSPSFLCSIINIHFILLMIERIRLYILGLWIELASDLMTSEIISSP